jgi:hypothetical protein
MTTTASAWDDQLKNLKARFPAVRDTILFCFQALTQYPDAEIDDLRRWPTSTACA